MREALKDRQPAVYEDGKWVVRIGSMEKVGVTPDTPPPPHTITEFLKWYREEGPGHERKERREKEWTEKRKAREAYEATLKKRSRLWKEQAKIQAEIDLLRKKDAKLDWYMEHETRSGLPVGVLPDIRDLEAKVKQYHTTALQWKEQLGTLRTAKQMMRAQKFMETALKKEAHYLAKLAERRQEFQHLKEQRKAAAKQLATYKERYKKISAQLSELVTEITYRRTELQKLYKKYGKWGREKWPRD